MKDCNRKKDLNPQQKRKSVISSHLDNNWGWYVFGVFGIWAIAKYFSYIVWALFECFNWYFFGLGDVLDTPMTQLTLRDLLGTVVGIVMRGFIAWFVWSIISAIRESFEKDPDDEYS